MGKVLQRRPEAHLILLGSSIDESYTEHLKTLMAQGRLPGHVSWLGSRDDVPGVLKGCDVGVLSSASEGLPLALIEYGMACLPAVATRVGQCEEVLDGGRAGILVPPASPETLADAILSLLDSEDLRARLRSVFLLRVRETYGVRKNLATICDLYETILMRGATTGSTGASKTP
jgi:glycosyltransferase involved in cell wall biosynthesis